MLRSKKNVISEKHAVVFGYNVKHPDRYGVASFDKNGKVNDIEEKPENPKSNCAIIGLYFYPNDVIEIAKNIKPSKRGELEISAVNQEFLKQERLFVELLGRGFAWLDTGTQEAMIDASNFIKTIEDRQGLKVACLEEIAYDQGFIEIKKLKELADKYRNNYGAYLSKLIED